MKGPGFLRTSLRLGLALTLNLTLCRVAHAQGSYTVFPSSINFGMQSIEFTSVAQAVTVTNTGTTKIVVNSFSVSPSPFQFSAGSAPWTIGPGEGWVWAVDFAPKTAGTFNGQLTLNITGLPPAVIPLTGTGFSTSAVATVSPSSIAFANQPVGSSATQTFTVTNTGTSNLTVTQVNNSSLFFTVTGFSQTTSLAPGSSLPLTVTFTPTAEVPYTGTVQITYKEVPANGVTLSGAGVSAPQLTVTSLNTLPTAIQQSAYLATLTSAGGVGQVNWALAPGSQLPGGLTLSSAGTISGTLTPSVGVGNHSFTVRATDSDQPPTTVQKLLTLPVDAPTGAQCNNITWDIVGTTTPIVAMTDLGTGTYLGVEGGLYPGGSNVRPAADDAAGVGIAQQIEPLDSNGNPDPNGQYVMLTIGESIADYESGRFELFASADPAKNSHLVVVDGAMAGESASYLADAGSSFWTTILNYRLPNAGVNANQVVVVWVEAIDGGPSGSFPGDITQLQGWYESIAQVIHNFFPNLKLAYYSTRIYGGYSIPGGGDPEPYAYETGYAVRGIVEDQLNGDPALNYNPALGPVLAPWLSWGPYYWANGLLGRADGLVWSCADFKKNDGFHPDTSGQDKVADAMLNYFKTDDTSTPWFLAPEGPVAVLSPASLTFADQSVGTTSGPQTITVTNIGIGTLSISSISLTGADPGDFAETNTCGAGIAAGANCTISVTFTPAAVGARTASLDIADNAPGSPQTIALAGTGVGGSPSVTLSPTSLTFSAQAVGTTSGAQVVTLTNTGSGSLSITSVSISGTNPGDYAETNTCGASVAAGATCTISVTFAPLGPNTRSATVSISDNASGSPQTVPLTGVGTAVQLAPGSLNFGSQAVGTTSPAQIVTLSNLLSKRLAVSSIRIDGTNPRDFAETNTCGSSVPAKGNCTISVTFTPRATGARTASLLLTDNGGGSPQAVPLSGSGT